MPAIFSCKEEMPYFSATNFNIGMNFRIRPIQKSDNLLLASIIRQVFDEHQAPQQATVYSDPRTDRLFEEFQHQAAAGFTAEMNGAVVGCGGIYPTDGLPSGYAELVKFYLTATARGKGIGSALMQRCFAAATSLNYRYLYIESLPQFKTAVGIYQGLGFRPLSHPLGNSGHSACNIWMLREL